MCLWFCFRLPGWAAQSERNALGNEGGDLIQALTRGRSFMKAEGHRREKAEGPGVL